MCSSQCWLQTSQGFSQIKRLFTTLFLREKSQRHVQCCLLVNKNPKASLRRLSNWDYTALRDPVLHGLQSPLLALQEKRLLGDCHEGWESGRRGREGNVLLCSQSCACFVNGCCLCLRSQASTFHVFISKSGSNSGGWYFPTQRVYILSKHFWDTELLFVSNEGCDCFNGLQRLWAGSSHYSPSMSHWALCTSGVVKRATELLLVSCRLKLNPLLSLLRFWKSLGHQERPSWP